MFLYFFVSFKRLHSSRSRWRVVSWSCGWRKSSICPGSCEGRTGWSWSTGWERTAPLAPCWRGNEAGWWGTRGTSGPIAPGGSGSGRARSAVSRWIRTDWTWGRGCGYQRSMAAEDEQTHYIKLVFLRSVAGLCQERETASKSHIFMTFSDVSHLCELLPTEMTCRFSAS